MPYNISMINCFEPIYSADSRVLILGSAPSVQSLKKGEYYGNKQNRFWRIMFDVLGEEYSLDYSVKVELLLKNGIAMWDTAWLCEREGSLDSKIKNVTFSDVPWLIRQTAIHTVFLNGGTSARLFSRAKYAFDREITVCALPSTSPANAKASYGELRQAYVKIAEALNKPF